MKKISITIISVIALFIVLFSCNDESFEEQDKADRIELAKELMQDCISNGECEDQVLCYYNNGLYHYMIFKWMDNYYDFAIIEGYPPDQYLSSDKSMDLAEAQEICDNLN